MRDFAAAFLARVPNLLCAEYRSPGLALALRKFFFSRATLLILLDRIVRRDEFAEWWTGWVRAFAANGALLRGLRGGIRDFFRVGTFCTVDILLGLLPGANSVPLALAPPLALKPPALLVADLGLLAFDLIGS